MFYLKRAQKTEKTVVDDYAYPIVGKIIIGRSITQFSTKLKAVENLWHVKLGRAIGKSKMATELNHITHYCQVNPLMSDKVISVLLVHLLW